jgi:NADPH-dependent curcumin reductase CurA
MDDITLTLPKEVVRTIIDALDALGMKKTAAYIAMQAAGQLKKGRKV